jgi:hypothetical protein
VPPILRFFLYYYIFWSYPDLSFLRSAALFEESAAAIRAEFGLTLFGFDAIVPSHASAGSGGSGGGGGGGGAGGVTVIDVNYFPSYKEVRDFPARLRRFLASRRSVPAPLSTGEAEVC